MEAIGWQSSAYFFAKIDVSDGEGEERQRDGDKDEVVHARASSWYPRQAAGEKWCKIMPLAYGSRPPGPN